MCRFSRGTRPILLFISIELFLLPYTIGVCVCASSNQRPLKMIAIDCGCDPSCRRAGGASGRPLPALLSAAGFQIHFPWDTFFKTSAPAGMLFRRLCIHSWERCTIYRPFNRNRSLFLFLSLGSRFFIFSFIHSLSFSHSLSLSFYILFITQVSVSRPTYFTRRPTALRVCFEYMHTFYVGRSDGRTDRVGIRDWFQSTETRLDPQQHEQQQRWWCCCWWIESDQANRTRKRKGKNNNSNEEEDEEEESGREDIDRLLTAFGMILSIFFFLFPLYSCSSVLTTWWWSPSSPSWERTSTDQ